LDEEDLVEEEIKEKKIVEMPPGCLKIIYLNDEKVWLSLISEVLSMFFQRLRHSINT
jgi:hypothetical protein